MIAKSYILKNLEILEKLYNNSTSTKNGLFYSKLAILELCGWTEESMDDIIRMCMNRKLSNKVSRDFIEKQIIQRTWGFEYNKHFRNMLVQVIGQMGIDRLEAKVNPVKLQLLVSTLNTLRTCRDTEAHTHIKGVTKRLDAPSVTKNRFLIVYDGLKEIEFKLKKVGC